MIGEPAGASEALAAFRRATVEADPLPALAEGFAIVLRAYGAGVLPPETRREITDELWRAEEAAAVHLPDAFGAARLHMGVVSLFALCVTWAKPIGSAERLTKEVLSAQLIVRTIRNDLDTICARREFDRDVGGLDPIVASALDPRTSVVH